MNTQIQIKNSFLAVILDSNFDQTNRSIRMVIIIRYQLHF